MAAPFEWVAKKVGGWLPTGRRYPRITSIAGVQSSRNRELLYGKDAPNTRVYVPWPGREVTRIFRWQAQIRSLGNPPCDSIDLGHTVSCSVTVLDRLEEKRVRESQVNSKYEGPQNILLPLFEGPRDYTDDAGNWPRARAAPPPAALQTLFETGGSFPAMVPTAAIHQRVKDCTAFEYSLR